MQQFEDAKLLGDPKYRAYVSSVDKCLKAFEHTSEWADLISALTKLNKVISSLQNYGIIPRAMTIGKRLAQCLHPALPAGVHLKALETYETVFTVLSTDKLAEDLSIYSAGLLPLMSHAAMTVKPLLLKLYESHILPLGASLKACSSGLILGILPGLEEGSEFYNWADSILERLRDVTGAEHFYSSLWFCLLNNSSVRLPGTCFMLSHIDKTRSMEDQLHLLGSDIAVLVRSLQSCLQDASILVQRNTLDILIAAFTFHGSQLTFADQSSLVQSSLLVLLRRDMSLNRRLYAWMLGITSSGAPMVVRSKPILYQRQDSGSSSASEPELEYFHQHARKFLIHSLQTLVSEPLQTDTVKPLRIVISLLDRPEIGAAVIEDIMLSVFRLLRHACSRMTARPFTANPQLLLIRLGTSMSLLNSKNGPSYEQNGEAVNSSNAEVLKTSNLLFSALEPNFPWEFLTDTFERVLLPSEVRKSDVSLMELCELAKMLLGIYSLETFPETRTVYLPRLFNNLITLTRESADVMSFDDLEAVMMLGCTILSRCLPSEPTGDTSCIPVTIHQSLPVLQDVISQLVPRVTTQAEQSRNPGLASGDLLSAEKCLLSCFLALMEISSFPVCEVLAPPPPADALPTWLRVIVEFSSMYRPGLSRCQILCMATIVDLITLSQLVEGPTSSANPSVAGPGCCPNHSAAVNNNSLHPLLGGTSSPTKAVPSKQQPWPHSVAASDAQDTRLVAISLQPAILPHTVEKLQSSLKTLFAVIWDQLSPEMSTNSCECAALMDALLSLPTTNQELQSLITDELISKDLDMRVRAHRKFALYWHHTRPLSSSKSHVHNIQMVALSALFSEAEIVQEVCRDWLLHSIQCDDMMKMVEPVLSLLLHSDTSRTSIQHKLKKHQSAGLAAPSEPDLSESLKRAEASITAISSDGQVVVTPKGTIVAPGSNGRPVLAITSELGTTVIHDSQLTDSVTQEGISTARIGMALNPFGSVSDLDMLIFDGFIPHKSLATNWRDADIQGIENASINNGEKLSAAQDQSSSEAYEAVISRAKRLDRETCTREGIDFSCQPELPALPELPAPILVPPLPQAQVDELVLSVEDKDSAASNYGLYLPPPLDDPEVIGIVTGILDEVIAQVVGVSEDSSDSVSEPDVLQIDHLATGAPANGASISLGANAFILIYNQSYDFDRVRFGLSVLKAIISIHPVSILASLMHTSADDSSSGCLLSLQARHRRALLGFNFYEKLSSEDVISLRNTRLLEVVVCVCLYYWRSYCSADAAFSQLNSLVQLQALDLLTLIASQLVVVQLDAPKGFPHYMADLMMRCKLQKTCLFHLQSLMSRDSKNLQALGVCLDVSVDEPMLASSLRLAESLIVLEAKLQIAHERALLNSMAVRGAAHSLFKKMIGENSVFLDSLLNCLSSEYYSLHVLWLSVIANVLPHIHAFPWMPNLVDKTVNKLCIVFQRVTSLIIDGKQRMLPPDYVAQLLHRFTLICLFCFTELSSNTIGDVDSTDTKQIVSTGQILSNLVSVFSPLSSASNLKLSPAQDGVSKGQGCPKSEARDRLLSMLPKVLSSLSGLWRVSLPDQTDNPKVVQLIIEFFSPILHNYAEQLLGSVSVVWSDSHDSSDSNTTQNTLVRLLLSLKALPMAIIVDKLRLVMRKPPNTDHATNAKVILQMSCLRFLRGCIKQSVSIPANSLSSVCMLLRHCLQLSLPPPGVLLLLETVHDFVMKFGKIEDRKILKELQEISSRVLEVCCHIISSQLESSSWALRRNYVVKVRSQSELSAVVNDTPGISMDESLESSESHDSEYACLALSLLARVTSALLDIVFPSEDKDKALPILYNLLSRIFPYLRNHSLLNMGCFLASSHFLANISTFQYARKAWRRDAVDLLLSPLFFQMDLPSLQFWKTITDNLVTHEKTMFKDLLAKFAVAGGGSIQLFSSKDVELAQRCHNLKKLSFLIYVADVDHYRHCLPEIQERLADNLRLNQSPVVLCQVFLCFRVLLLRMSSSNLTSLWPTMVTELVHILCQMEQDLKVTEEEETLLSRVSEIDSSSCLNGHDLQNTALWLQLYLSACKFLDLLLFLPPTVIPEFQYYAWSFRGIDPSTENPGGLTHVPLIVKLMDAKFGKYKASIRRRGALLLQEQTITNLKDLQPFFVKLLQSDTMSQTDGRDRLIHHVESVMDNDLIEAPL